MNELYVPVFMPLEHKLITLSNNTLLHARMPERGSAERIARQFASDHLGLTAIKAIGKVSYGDAVGYAVHTAIDQPYELQTAHRFIIKVQDIDEYLASEQTSEVDAALVTQATEQLPYKRRTA